MTTQDYIKIAATIRNLGYTPTTANVVRAFSDMLAADNPRFDRREFENAAFAVGPSLPREVVYQAVALEPIETLDEDDYKDEETIGIYTHKGVARSATTRYIEERLLDGSNIDELEIQVRDIELNKDLVYPQIKPNG